MLAPELKRDINRLWDKFWSGGIANPLTAIEQIVYLIFMKRLEETDNDNARRDNPDFKSTFEGPNDLRRWSQFSHLKGEEMLEVVREKVFPLIKQLGGSVMRDAVFVIPSATMLEGAVGIINKLYIPSRNVDTFGDIYEYLLNEIKTSGKNGQFRTPRHMIRAIIQMVNPVFDGRRLPRICDPACGTAGFLVNSYIHIMAANTDEDILRIEADGTPQVWTGNRLGKNVDLLRSNTFYGYDFDPTMVRIGWMNMIQHGIKVPHIEYADALSKQSEIKLPAQSFDYVFANPPFTGSIEQKDKSTRFKLKTNKTELLFLELFLDLLIIGGRAGVIVPEGVLFGSTTAHREIRKQLIQQNQLEAVVSLPAGVFQPYTGVKTSALIFTKGGQTESVWFYEVRQDGQTLDAKREERPEQNDLWDLVKKYPTRDTSLTYHRPIIREETWQNGESYPVKMFKGTEVIPIAEPHAWTATAKQIEENDWHLSAARFKPFKLTPIQYAPPAKTIRELQAMENDIMERLGKLLAMVEDKQ